MNQFPSLRALDANQSSERMWISICGCIRKATENGLKELETLAEYCINHWIEVERTRRDELEGQSPPKTQLQTAGP